MKVRKMLISCLCILVCVALLAGCGNDPKPTPAATPTPVPSDPIITEKPEEIFMKPGDTYRYYSWDFVTENQYIEQEGIRGEAIRQRYNDMKEKYGINIEFVVAIGHSWDWMDAPLEASYSGNPITDVMNAGGPFTLLSCYLYQGIPGSAIDAVSDYSEAGTFSDAKYWDVPTQNETGIYGGKLYFPIPKLYGADMCSLLMVTIFNKELVQRAGYEPEDFYTWSKNGEWTWDKFKEVAIAATNESNGTVGTVAGEHYALLRTLITGNGGDFIAKRDIDGVKKDRFVAHEDNALKAWEFYIDLSKQNAVIQYQQRHQDADFATGKVAMMCTYIASVNTIYELIGDTFTYGVIMPPKGPDVDDYISDANWFAPICLMKNTKNPKGTVQFMEKFFAPPIDPDSEDSLTLLEAELSQYLHDEESLQTCIDVIQKAHPSSYMIYHKFNNYQIRNYLIVPSVIDKLVSGELTASAYLASVEDAINALIDQALAV